MPRNVKEPLLAAIFCAAAILPLAVLVYWFGPVEHVDLRLLLDMKRESGPVHDLGAALVNLGDLPAMLAMVAVVCGLGLAFERRRQVWAALAVVAGANLTTQLLKVVLEHTRHMPWDPGIELPYTSPFPSGNSFPSGHTTAMASVAVALLLVVPARYRPLAGGIGFALTAAVGISVVVLGWHYPSDVLGGLLVVGAWGFAALAYLRLRTDRARAVGAGDRSGPRHLAVSTD